MLKMSRKQTREMGKRDLENSVEDPHSNYMSMCGATTPCDTISLVSKETIDLDNEENLPELPNQSNSFKRTSKPVVRAVTFKFPPLPEEAMKTDISDEKFEVKTAVYSRVLPRSLRRKNTSCVEESKDNNAVSSEQTVEDAESSVNNNTEVQKQIVNKEYKKENSPHLLTTDL